MSIRTERVAHVIRETIGQALARGNVKDPRVQKAGLITVTHVRVSEDLSVAWVRVTVWGGEIESALEGLRAASGFLRCEVGKELQGKRVPELRFDVDRDAEREAKVEAAFREIEEERRKNASAQSSSEPLPDGGEIPDSIAFEDTERVEVPYPAHPIFPPLRRRKEKPSST